MTTQPRAAVCRQPEVGVARRERRRVRTLATRYRTLHIVLLLPAALTVVALVGWPLVNIASISLHDVQLHEIMRAINKPFTLENYRRAIFTPEFLDTLWITAKYVFASTAIALLLGFGTALLLNGSFRGRAVFRTIIISPWAVAPVIASLVWMFLLDKQFGVVNYLLLKVGLVSEPVEWLVNPTAALWALIIVHAWKAYPFFTVMLLAGLQAIPQNLYEAATVDGAGRVRQFVDITVPALRQVLTIAGVLSLLSAFRDVETILVLTKGGPARLTETLAVRIYNENFEYFDVGASSAMGVAGFAISLLSIIVFFRLLKQDFYR